MIRIAARATVLLATLFTAGILPAAEPETKPAPPSRVKPLVWAGLRSVERVEQRLREIATMAGRPGLDKLMLGMLETELGDLTGLDRSRPIHVAIAAPNLLGIPRFVVTVPVADRLAAERALRKHFPETVPEGDALRLQGGFTNLVARFDAEAATVGISLTLDSLTAVDTTVPPDIWPDTGGPDLVVRWDADATRKHFAGEWQGVRAEILKALAESRRELLATDPDQTTRASLLAFLDLWSRGVEHAIDDLRSVGWSLQLGQAGWETTLSARMRPGSASAAFLRSIVPAGATLPPVAPDAWFRSEGGLGLTEELRTVGRALMDEARKEMEKNAETDRAVLEKIRPLVERILAQPAVGAALEIAGTMDAPRIDFVSLHDEAETILTTLLDLWSGTRQVEREVARHDETPIHRVRERDPQPDTPDVPDAIPIDALYAAARKGCLLIGTSLDHLKRQLDRLKNAATPDGGTQPVERAPAPPPLARMEVYLGRMVRAVAESDPFGFTSDPDFKRILGKIPEQDEKPFLVDLRSGGGSLSLRVVLPGTLVRALCEIAGEQMPGGADEDKPAPDAPDK